MRNYKKAIFCPLCGAISKEINVWIETNSGNIFQCNICGLGFLDPEKSNTLEINTSIYNSKTYYELLKRNQNELNLRYKNQMKEINKLVKGKGKIVDIGCSIGMFLNIAASVGYEPYGYDINKINLLRAKNFFKINILPDDYLENQKYNNFFDVATLWDVLEHIPNPIDFLSLFIKKMKKNGLLVVQCPNMESYEFSKFGKNWNWLTPGDHLFFFTPTTLTKVLVTAGFHPIKVKIWMDGLTFSNSMLSMRNKDPTFIFNRLLYKMIFKLKKIFQKLNLNIPFEKILGIYGRILQIIHHIMRRHSLIKVYAIKP